MGRGNFRGMGGMGGGNMNALMAQAQKMQRDMEEAQNNITLLRMEGTSGGGQVKITLGGDHKIYGLEINKKVIDPEDPEMLSDLIVAAYQSALEQIESASSEMMNKATGGMKLPF